MIKMWPAWRYGPDNQAEIFNGEEQVPRGWQDHPSKLETRDEEEANGKADADADEKAQEGQMLKTRRGRPPKVREEQF